MVDDIVEDKLELLVEIDNDDGPGLGCVSPAQSSNLTSHASNTTIKITVTTSETKYALAIALLPGDINL